MDQIADIPFFEANFDRDGNLREATNLSTGQTTDVFVISHGWNNNKEEAKNLYNAFFANFGELKRGFDFTERSLSIVGVYWPSKKFDDLSFAVGETNLTTIGVHNAGGEALLAKKLDELKKLFVAPAEKHKLEAAKTVIAKIENSPAARKEFVSNIRGLLDPSAQDREDASDSFFQDTEEELMEALKLPIAATVPSEAVEGGASLDVGRGKPIGEGGGIGSFNLIDSFKTAAFNILNYTTYYEMKTRAGNVGANGVGPLVDLLAGYTDKIHLIGHSFGGRVVAAAVKGSTTKKLASLTLLQAAFSHNGFSKVMHGFFRKIVDAKRIAGPILITNTKNDKAVGLAYPIASRINSDSTMAIGDANDKFGGMGRNGAQKMEAGEVDANETLLRKTGEKYAFSSGKFFNLRGDDFIKDHGDVTGKEIINALLNAVTQTH